MANRQTLFRREAGTAFASEIESNLFQGFTRTGCSLSVGVNERRQSLGENPARAFRIAADELGNVQGHLDADAYDRKVGDAACLTAMNGSSQFSTSRTADGICSSSPPSTSAA